MLEIRKELKKNECCDTMVECIELLGQCTEILNTILSFLALLIGTVGGFFLIYRQTQIMRSQQKLVELQYQHQKDSNNPKLELTCPPTYVNDFIKLNIKNKGKTKATNLSISLGAVLFKSNDDLIYTKPLIKGRNQKLELKPNPFLTLKNKDGENELVENLESTFSTSLSFLLFSNYLGETRVYNNLNFKDFVLLLQANNIQQISIHLTLQYDNSLGETMEPRVVDYGKIYISSISPSDTLSKFMISSTISTETYEEEFIKKFRAKVTIHEEF